MGVLRFRGAFRCTLIVAIATAWAAAPSPAAADFGLQPGSFTATQLDEQGQVVEQPQAGGHPSAMRLQLSFETRDEDGGAIPDGAARTLVADFPPGLLGNPEAVPQCAQSDFPPSGSFGSSRCPAAAQVGVAELLTSLEPGVEPSHSSTPIFNLTPNEGVFARLGFVEVAPVVIDFRLRPGPDYAMTATIRNLSQIVNVYGASLTLWGVPADSGGPSGASRIPFLSNPTRCGTPLSTGIRIDSWQQPDRFLSYLTPPLEFVGCDQPAFEPAIAAAPTTDRADSPTGLEFDLHIPQNEGPEGHEDPDGVASAQLRDARVKLPEGLTVNPAAAARVEGCSPAQVGVSVDGVPDDSPVSCPAASKIGLVEAVSPAVGHPLPGSVYLASPGANPFGALLAVYLVVDDPFTGLLVKVAGRIDPDPRTGQLTVVFDDSPQLPFEDLRLRTFDGPGAVLRTPTTCGRHVTTAELLPWTHPQGVVAEAASSFDLSASGACSPDGAAAPHQPTLAAGSLDAAAGAYAPLVVRLSRSAGSQPLRSVDATLPEGLLASLDGTSFCSEGALRAATDRSGAEERGHPSCPADSRVGGVEIGAGAGPDPLAIAGDVYLAGPYRSAPLSLAIVVPVVAGPFDLGTLVVRIALTVDPRTAQVRAESDPLPTILRGIPLDLRSISVKLDKSGFTRNPTSCEPTSIEAEATSALGERAALSERFQVDDCGLLALRPRLSLQAHSGTGRGGHPQLRAVLKAGPREAGISAVAITLPAGELLDLRRLGSLCDRTQRPQSCPPSSRLGRVRVWSPLLREPLEGPIYLRTPSGRLPDLLGDLRGGNFHFTLHGRTTTRGGRLGIRFDRLPDAPLSKAEVTLAGGRRGIVANSESLCGRTLRGTLDLTAHSGAVRHLRPLLRAPRC